MNITALAIKNRQVTWLLITIIFVLAWSSLKDIPKAQDPGFTLRVAQVSTLFPGASPERVEMLVTDPLEKVIMEMPELDFVTSSSKTGYSQITVNIKDGYSELRPIWDKLRRKIDSVQSTLPDGVMPSVVNDEFGDVFGIVLSITSDGFDYAYLKEVADEVKDELLRLPLVAKINLYGDRDERIYVDYNDARLAELGLSPAYLGSILSQQNIINPGGEIYTPKEVITLEPTGNFISIAQLQQVLIPLPGSSQLVPLRDLANVYRDYIDPPKSVVNFNGKQTIALAVSMIDTGNIVALGEQVKNRLNALQEAYPLGITFDVIAYQPTLVEGTISSFLSNLLQAIIVVTTVMLLFLGLRTGLVVATLIPSTIAATLVLMYYLGIGLDQVSLAALMIALGMLVDNSIVVSESTVKYMEDGLSAMAAAIKSATELKIPLLTSSLTTSAAFMPIILAESTTGEYTAPIFKVVTIALLFSWILAITVIPMLCVAFIRIKPKAATAPGLFTRLEQRYGKGLFWMLNHRAITLAVIFAVFFIALYGLRFVPSGFFPPSQDPIVTMEIELPEGTPIYHTEKVVKEIEAFMAQFLESDVNKDAWIKNWAAYIGNGGPRFVLTHSARSASPNYAYFLINATRSDVLDQLMVALENKIFATQPDVTFKIGRLQTGSPVKNPIEIRLSGKDLDILYTLADQVKQKLIAIPGTKHVQDDWGRQTKKLVMDIDESRAQRLAVSNADVAQSLQAGFGGIRVSDFRERDNLIPIVLRNTPYHQNGSEKLSTYSVYSQSSGQAYALGQVLAPVLSWQPAVVYRRDRLKTLTIMSQLDAGANANAVAKEIGAQLSIMDDEWGAGYRWALGGEMEKSGQANSALVDKLPIAVMAILLLMMLQFCCIRRTGIILMTIPLGLIGVSFGLNIAQSYIGFMTLLGIISLAGIVINNAIVLIDRIDIECETKGRSLNEAILLAGKHRFRPILLTTATTVLGMMPLWFAGGPMWEPMAISIIFGLLGATGLTLGFVPVMFSMLFNSSKRQEKSVEQVPIPS